MQYQPHIVLRVSVTSFTAPSEPAFAPNGRVKEHTEGPLWYASTNPREVAKALLKLNSMVGIELTSPTGGDIERSTSFSIKYDRTHWTSVSAAATVANLIEEINVLPKEVKPVHYPTRPLPVGHSVYADRWPNGYPG